MKKNIAIFSCGDENYVPQMCVALKIACKYNENFKPYILSDVSDPDLMKTINKLGITLLQVDLSQHFEIHNSDWPNHMFWYFIAPETLKKMGHDFSMFIDADVYCRQELDLDWLIDDVEIAARSDRDGEFNSGVVFFNNNKMVEKKLFESALSVYGKFSGDDYLNWHGGLVHDQQVLTALGSGNKFHDFWGSDSSFDILDLDVTWNYIFHHAEGRNEKYLKMKIPKLESELNCIHFLLSRPWLPTNEWGGQHGLFHTKDFPEGWVVKTKKGEPKPESRIHFINKWREEVRSIEDEYGVKLFDDFDEMKGQ
jgi:lipopolysaccharide biosynthesis glycosyltransferase